jgi:2-oxoglutarate dehydrogenase E2 component (dihydrolipoamide succinyltransferase)
MSVILQVPSIGESISEVVVGEWFKAEGDWVEMDENILVIESDKANLEVPSPVEGKLLKIYKQVGETAQVGETIAELEACAIPETASSQPEAAPEPAGAPAPAPVAPAAVASEVSMPVDAEPSVRESDGTAVALASGIMPAAARLLAEHGMSAAGI